MTIYVDGAFAKLSAASTYSEMSTTTKAALDAALATLLAKPNIAAMISGISHNVIITTFTDGLVDPRSSTFHWHFGTSAYAQWKVNLRPISR